MVSLGTVEIGLKLDTRQYDAGVKKVKDGGKFNLNPIVDHGPLEALNAHLDLKQEHFQQLQDYFDRNPLTPRADGSELDGLMSLMMELGEMGGTVGASGTAGASQSAKEAGQKAQTGGTIADEFAKGTEKAFNKVAGFITAPFKGIGRGFFEGIGQSFSQEMTQGFKDVLGERANINVKDLGRQVGAAIVDELQKRQRRGPAYDYEGVAVHREIGVEVRRLRGAENDPDVGERARQEPKPRTQAPMPDPWGEPGQGTPKKARLIVDTCCSTNKEILGELKSLHETVKSQGGEQGFPDELEFPEVETRPPELVVRSVETAKQGVENFGVKDRARAVAETAAQVGGGLSRQAGKGALEGVEGVIGVAQGVVNAIPKPPGTMTAAGAVATTVAGTVLMQQTGIAPEVAQAISYYIHEWIGQLDASLVQAFQNQISVGVVDFANLLQSAADFAFQTPDVPTNVIDKVYSLIGSPLHGGSSWLIDQIRDSLLNASQGMSGVAGAALQLPSDQVAGLLTGVGNIVAGAAAGGAAMGVAKPAYQRLRETLGVGEDAQFEEVFARIQGQIRNIREASKTLDESPMGVSKAQMLVENRGRIESSIRLAQEVFPEQSRKLARQLGEVTKAASKAQQILTAFGGQAALPGEVGIFEYLGLKEAQYPEGYTPPELTPQQKDTLAKQAQNPKKGDFEFAVGADSQVYVLSQKSGRQRGVITQEGRLEKKVGPNPMGTEVFAPQTPPALPLITPAPAQQSQEIARLRAEIETLKQSVQPPRGPGSSFSMPTEEIQFDPKRFQYKITANKEGTSGSLKGINKDNWVPESAGVITVWKDPQDGKYYVINGHNRLAKAKEIGVESVNVLEIEASSAKEARAKGAADNIRQGSGTILDAADFFRQSGITDVAELKRLGIPLSQSKATQGIGVAQLPGDLYSKALTGELPIERAALLGGSGLAEQQIRELVVLAEKRKLDNSKLSAVIDEMKASVNQGQVINLGLFDDFTAGIVERAELVSAINKKIDNQLAALRSISDAKKAQMVKVEGIGNIDRERAKSLVTGVESAKTVFATAKTQDKYVSGMIGRGTDLIRGGADTGLVEDTLVKMIRGLAPLMDRGQDLSQYGEDTIRGFLEGLHNEEGQLDKTTLDLARALPKNFRDVLGIKSPSKVFELIGKDVVRGLEKGLDGFEGTLEEKQRLLQTYVKNFIQKIIPVVRALIADISTELDYQKALGAGDSASMSALVQRQSGAEGYNVGPVYHGTSAEFNEFDKSKQSPSSQYKPAFFFTSDNTVAEQYKKNNEGRVITAYLSGYTVKQKRQDRANGLPTKEVNMINRPEDRGIVAVDEPNQIKSADPATYDDDGRPVPLLKRFDDSVADIRGNLAPGLPRGIQSNLGRLRKVGAGIVDEFVSQLEAQLTEAFDNVGAGMIAQLNGAFSSLQSVDRDLDSGVIDVGAVDMGHVGEKSHEERKQAIQPIVSGQNPVTPLASGARNAVPVFAEVGKNASSAMVSAIRSELPALSKSGKQMGTVPLEGAKDALEIDSPSKAFMKVGAWAVKGLAEGFKDPSALKEIQNLAKQIEELIAASFPHIGQAVAAGMAKGMAGAGKALGRKFAFDFIGSVKEGFGMKSPARKIVEIAQNINNTFRTNVALDREMEQAGQSLSQKLGRIRENMKRSVLAMGLAIPLSFVGGGVEATAPQVPQGLLPKAETQRFETVGKFVAPTVSDTAQMKTQEDLLRFVMGTSRDDSGLNYNRGIVSVQPLGKDLMGENLNIIDAYAKVNPSQKITAWIENPFALPGSTTPEQRKQMGLGASSVLNENTMFGVKRQMLDPLDKTVQTRLIGMVSRLAQSPKVDAVALDDHFKISPEQVQLLSQKYGYSPEKIQQEFTGLLGKVKGAMGQKELAFSHYGNLSQTKSQFTQDIPQWMKGKLIDRVGVQLYVENLDSFKKTLDREVEPLVNNGVGVEVIIHGDKDPQQKMMAVAGQEGVSALSVFAKGSFVSEQDPEFVALTSQQEPSALDSAMAIGQDPLAWLSLMGAGAAFRRRKRKEEPEGAVMPTVLPPIVPPATPQGGTVPSYTTVNVQAVPVTNPAPPVSALGNSFGLPPTPPVAPVATPLPVMPVVPKRSKLVMPPLLPIQPPVAPAPNLPTPFLPKELRLPTPGGPLVLAKAPLPTPQLPPAPPALQQGGALVAQNNLGSWLAKAQTASVEMVKAVLSFFVETREQFKTATARLNQFAILPEVLPPEMLTSPRRQALETQVVETTAQRIPPGQLAPRQRTVLEAGSVMALPMGQVVVRPLQLNWPTQPPPAPQAQTQIPQQPVTKPSTPTVPPAPSASTAPPPPPKPPTPTPTPKPRFKATPQQAQDAWVAYLNRYPELVAPGGRFADTNDLNKASRDFIKHYAKHGKAPSWAVAPPPPVTPSTPTPASPPPPPPPSGPTPTHGGTGFTPPPPPPRRPRPATPWTAPDPWGPAPSGPSPRPGAAPPPPPSPTPTPAVATGGSGSGSPPSPPAAPAAPGSSPPPRRPNWRAASWRPSAKTTTLEADVVRTIEQGSVEFYENQLRAMRRAAENFIPDSAGFDDKGFVLDKIGETLFSGAQLFMPALAPVLSVLPLTVPAIPTVLAGAGMAASGAPLIRRANTAIQEVEPIAQRFTTIAGNEALGRQRMDQVMDLSNTYAIDSASSGDYFAQFAAATRGSNVIDEELIDFYEAVAASIKAIGAPTEDARLIFLAYTQLLSKGKLTMEEIRQQLAEKFPPAAAIFAKALGTSTAGLEDLVSRGAISTEKWLRPVTKALKEDFGDAALQAGDNYTSALVRIQNANFALSRSFTEHYSKIFTVGGNLFAGFINQVNNHFDWLSSFVTTGLISLGAVFAAGVTQMLRIPGVEKHFKSAMNLFIVSWKSSVRLITPLFVGILADTLEEFFGTDNTIFSNMFKGVENLILGTGLAKAGEPISNPLAPALEGLDGLRKAVPSGVVEMAALVLMFEQVRALGAVFLKPTLQNFRYVFGEMGRGIQQFAKEGLAQKSLGDLFAGSLIGLTGTRKADVIGKYKTEFDDLRRDFAQEVGGAPRSAATPLTLDEYNERVQKLTQRQGPLTRKQALEQPLQLERLNRQFTQGEFVPRTLLQYKQERERIIKDAQAPGMSRQDAVAASEDRLRELKKAYQQERDIFNEGRTFANGVSVENDSMVQYHARRDELLKKRMRAESRARALAFAGSIAAEAALATAVMALARSDFTSELEVELSKSRKLIDSNISSIRNTLSQLSKDAKDTAKTIGNLGSGLPSQGLELNLETIFLGRSEASFKTDDLINEINKWQPPDWYKQIRQWESKQFWKSQKSDNPFVRRLGLAFLGPAGNRSRIQRQRQANDLGLKDYYAQNVFQPPTTAQEQLLDAFINIQKAGEKLKTDFAAISEIDLMGSGKPLGESTYQAISDIQKLDQEIANLRGQRADFSELNTTESRKEVQKLDQVINDKLRKRKQLSVPFVNVTEFIDDTKKRLEQDLKTIEDSEYPAEIKVRLKTALEAQMKAEIERAIKILETNQFYAIARPLEDAWDRLVQQLKDVDWWLSRIQLKQKTGYNDIKAGLYETAAPVELPVQTAQVNLQSLIEQRDTLKIALDRNRKILRELQTLTDGADSSEKRSQIEELRKTVDEQTSNLSELGLNIAQASYELRNNFAVGDYWRNLTRQIEDFYLDLENQQLAISQQIEQQRRSLEDAAIGVFRENREMTESYADLMADLEAQLDNAKTELANNQDQIRATRFKRDLLGVAVGVDNPGRQFANIFATLFDSLNGSKAESRKLENQQQQVQRDYINTLRRIRAEQEKQLDAERNRTRQMVDLANATAQMAYTLKKQMLSLDRSRFDSNLGYQRETRRTDSPFQGQLQAPAVPSQLPPPPPYQGPVTPASVPAPVIQAPVQLPAAPQTPAEALQNLQNRFGGGAGVSSGPGGPSSPVNNIVSLPRGEYLSPSERSAMIQMVAAEAEGEGLRGMAAVALTIRNRFKGIMSGAVPLGAQGWGVTEKSMMGVLSAKTPTGKYQYSPMGDGRFNKTYSAATMEQAARAVDASLQPESVGLGSLQNATNFQRADLGRPGWWRGPHQRIGDHNFGFDRFSAPAQLRSSLNFGVPESIEVARTAQLGPDFGQIGRDMGELGRKAGEFWDWLKNGLRSPLDALGNWLESLKKSPPKNEQEFSRRFVRDYADFLPKGTNQAQAARQFLTQSYPDKKLQEIFNKGLAQFLANLRQAQTPAPKPTPQPQNRAATKEERAARAKPTGTRPLPQPPSISNPNSPDFRERVTNNNQPLPRKAEVRNPAGQRRPVPPAPKPTPKPPAPAPKPVPQIKPPANKPLNLPAAQKPKAPPLVKLPSTPPPPKPKPQAAVPPSAPIFLPPPPVFDFEMPTGLAGAIYSTQQENLGAQQTLNQENFTLALAQAQFDLQRQKIELEKAQIDFQRSTQDSRLAIDDLIMGAKGYLSAWDEIKKAGLDVEAQYRSQRRALEDQIRELDLGLLGSQEFVSRTRAELESVRSQLNDPTLSPTERDFYQSNLKAAEELLANAERTLEIYRKETETAKAQYKLDLERLNANEKLAKAAAERRKEEELTLDAIQTYADKMGALATARYNLGGTLLNQAPILTAKAEQATAGRRAALQAQTLNLEPAAAQSLIAAAQETANLNLKQSYVEAIPFLKEFSSSLKDAILLTSTWQEALKKVLDLVASTVLDQLVIKPVTGRLAEWLAPLIGLDGGVAPAETPVVDPGALANTPNQLGEMFGQTGPGLTQGASGALGGFTQAILAATTALSQLVASLGGAAMSGLSGLGNIIGPAVGTALPSFSPSSFIDPASALFTGASLLLPGFAKGGEVDPQILNLSRGGEVDSQILNLAKGGEVDSQILNFAKGGEVDGEILNFAKGGEVGLANLGANAIKALKREKMEGGGQPVLAALTVGEIVIPRNKAPLYREFEQSLRVSQLTQQIPTMNTGGVVGGGSLANINNSRSYGGQSVTVSNNTNVTVESRNDLGYSLSQIERRNQINARRAATKF